MNTCGFVPYPKSGAYGDWACERSRGHLGRHRFRNYTIGRVPRAWHLRSVWRGWRFDVRHGSAPGMLRRALFPSAYDPVPPRAAGDVQEAEKPRDVGEETP